MSIVVPAVRAEHLGKKYGRRVALTDCTLIDPDRPGHRHRRSQRRRQEHAARARRGLTHPTSGTIETLGAAPAADPQHLARVGLRGAGRPVYPGLTVAEHLRMGAELNPGWDATLARARIEQPRPGPDPARRQAVGRPARPARP